MRAGSPETDHADPSTPRDPVTPPGWDVSPREGCEGRPRDQSAAPGRMERTLWRGEPQEGTDGRPARVGDRTDPCREQGPEDGRVSACTSRCGAGAGNVTRAGPPKGGTAAHGGNAL